MRSVTICSVFCSEACKVSALCAHTRENAQYVVVFYPFSRENAQNAVALHPLHRRKAYKVLSSQ